MTLDQSDLSRAAEIYNVAPAAAMELAAEWCAACGVTMNEIRGPSRNARMVRARQGLMYVLHHRLGMSLPDIGRMMRRDRTTVVHGVRAEEKRRAIDHGLKDC